MIRTDVVIRSDLDLVWRAWTESDRITEWFAPAAEIEAKENGKFELFFDPANKDHMSTQGCKILKIDRPHALVFEWKGPDPFAEIMNQAGALTHVSVTFAPTDDGTKVTVEHTGWGESDDWERAKQWHVQAWREVLDSLKSSMESGEGILCCK
jgi:uncharacterized protein YndB with AHSA1/START domain